MSLCALFYVYVCIVYVCMYVCVSIVYVDMFMPICK